MLMMLGAWRFWSCVRWVGCSRQGFLSAGVFQRAFPFLSAGASCVVVGEGIGVPRVVIGDYDGRE